MKTSQTRALYKIETRRAPLATTRLGASVAVLSVAAALCGNAARAQTATTLPAVTVQAPREKPQPAAKPKPAPVAASAQRARVAQRAPAQRAAPALRSTSAPAAPPAPAPFVPQGEQLGRGPSGVVGYVARGTSTATKTNTPILDIPQSVSIVTQQQLKDRNSLSLGQALTYVPGVTVTGGEGNTDQVTIRGQNTTADFFRDGVRDDAEYYRDLYNIQSVEVLKGPSAVIFGRGGGGGVINRVTKKADGETIRDVEVSTGSFGRKRVTTDTGQAITDTFAARLNTLYEQSYSYRNFFALERYGINPTFTWKPDESTFATFSYEHFHDRRTADRGIPSIGGLTYLGAVVAPGYPSPAPGYAFFGDANPNALEVNHARADVNTLDLNVQHKTDFGLEIRNHTVYADYKKGYQNTFPEEPFMPEGIGVVGISGYKRATPRTNVFNQTDLIYKFDMTPEIRHTFLAGAEIGNQKSASNLDYPCFNLICGNALVDTPFVTPTTYAPVAYADLGQRRHTDLTTASGYVQDQIAVTKYVDLLASVRFDRFDLLFAGNDFTPLAASSEAEKEEGESVSVTRGNFRQINNVWSPRFGVVVKPTEQLSFYGSYSRSFLPLAGDQFILLTPAMISKGPQGFENFEIGAKAQITPRLLFTAALYQLNRSNQPLVVDPINQVLANTRTNGGEVALTGYLTDQWQVSLGYGHQEARVRSADRPFNPETPLYRDAGKVVPLVPQDTFSVWNKYDLSSLVGFAPGALGVGAGVIYNSMFFPAIDNSVIVPGYARVDAALYWKVTDRISAQVNVENLLGAHYYVAASNNNNIMPGAPRSAFLTVNAKF